MHVDIQSVATISANASIKRRKVKDVEVVNAKIKFKDALVSRETIDAFLGRPIGWTTSALFDDMGRPLLLCEWSLPVFTAAVSGTIQGTKEADVIKLLEADLSHVSFILVDNGAKVDGEIEWTVAGDEASDLEPLLGRLCGIHWVVQKPEQEDFLKEAA